MHGDFLDSWDAAGTPIALFIRKPFEVQVALMVFIFNFCSFCSLVPRGRRHSTRGACAIARALQDRIRFKRVEELQASRFLGRCWRYFSTQAFGSFILLSFFGSIFVFFFFSRQLQKHFNERWKISCCLRKGFYSTSFPQFSRWYRTVRTGDRARDESKNKAVNTQLTDEQIKFTGEISVSCNQGIFWKEESLQVSRESTAGVSCIGLPQYFRRSLLKC